MNEKKIIIFGAGKIGRSFIGHVFNNSGFEVLFVDINKQLIDLLNRERRYKVIIKDRGKEEILHIENVRGLYLNDEDNLIKELLDARLTSLSVGQKGLKAAIPIIAKSLVERRKVFGDTPLDIIIAENMRNADVFIRQELISYLPHDYPLENLVGLVETSIGKMVPIMTQKDIDADPLQVFAEPYNTLIVAKNSLKNTVPDVQYLAPKDNIKAWVDRKLFIHNLGHATTTYIGYKAHPDATYVSEVLEDKNIYDTVRKTMLQAADILLAMYPEEFTKEQLEEHIDDLLYRFGNRSLGDTIFRVGCDLYRKLGSEDRLVSPVKAAIRLGKPYSLILDAIIAAISFRAKDAAGNCLPSDEQFFEEAKQGTRYILNNVCKLYIDLN